ncbi:tyrosine-protein phosphatase non-receptor type substrate 1-like isoform X2 [Erpetoichthys calabaricus]|uniref:tyrosine-protein phosphatase non-receptor type substrate 1-like isoform X2 n=1 Tax=Erpetoichthys calabaricus TaxID=27687 RepID=UPI0022343A95|nr:tyrosine-protein phosphatase non-receptor type substrate 1-like isoform X2 [Erpetoichthys calabaricus]
MCKILWLTFSFITVTLGEFQVSPPFLEVNTVVNSEVRLPCEFSLVKLNHGLKYLLLTWKVKDVELAQVKYGKVTSSDKVALFENEIHKGNGSLLLRNINIQDEGDYVCEVYEAPRSGTCTVRLKVTALPKVSLNPPMAVGNIPTTLECRAEGFYPGNISIDWVQESRPLSSQGPLQLHKNTDGTFTAWMAYNYIPEKVGKKLSCVVKHESQERSLPLQICSPSLSVSHRTLLRNKKRNVTCMVGGCHFNKVTVSWKQNGTVFNESECESMQECASNMVIMLSSAEDQVNFTCEAKVEGLSQPFIEFVTFIAQGHSPSDADTERGHVLRRRRALMDRGIQLESRKEKSQRMKGTTDEDTGFRKRGNNQKGKKGKRVQGSGEKNIKSPSEKSAEQPRQQKKGKKKQA